MFLFGLHIPAVHSVASNLNLHLYKSAWKWTSTHHIDMLTKAITDVWLSYCKTVVGQILMRYCCAVLELLVTLRLKGNQDVATCKYLSMNVFASFNTSTLRCPLQHTLFLWSLFCFAREINIHVFWYDPPPPFSGTLIVLFLFSTILFSSFF